MPAFTPPDGVRLPTGVSDPEARALVRRALNAVGEVRAASGPQKSGLYDGLAVAYLIYQRMSTTLLYEAAVQEVADKEQVPLGRGPRADLLRLVKLAFPGQSAAAQNRYANTLAIGRKKALDVGRFRAWLDKGGMRLAELRSIRRSYSGAGSRMGVGPHKKPKEAKLAIKGRYIARVDWPGAPQKAGWVVVLGRMTAKGGLEIHQAVVRHRHLQNRLLRIAANAVPPKKKGDAGDG